jgi:hypothetical protein
MGTVSVARIKAGIVAPTPARRTSGLNATND